MTTTEKIAKAIHEGRNGHGCKPWGRLADAHKEPYLLDARKAQRESITAMPDLGEGAFEDIEEAAGMAMRRWERGYLCQDIRIQHSLSWWIIKEVEARVLAAFEEESAR